MGTKADLVRLLEASGLAYELIESGSRWILVAPALGARILGAGLGEENVFWVSPAPTLRGSGEWLNAGGQRSWLAPESGPGGIFFSADGSRWVVPPALDPGNYAAIPAAGAWRSYRTSLVAEAANGGRYPIALTRSMRLEEEAGPEPSTLLIRFRHELLNTGTETLDARIGLWTPLQLPNAEGGTIFFGLTEAVRGSVSSLRPYFTTPPPGAVGASGRLAWLRVKGGERYKVGLPASASAGSIACVRRSRTPTNDHNSYLLVALRFAVDPDGTYLDKPDHSGAGAALNGDAAQAYNDPGTGDLAFCEIEAHASAPRLAPGESSGAELSIIIARLGAGDLEAFFSQKLGMDPPPKSALPAMA